MEPMEIKPTDEGEMWLIWVDLLGGDPVAAEFFVTRLTKFLNFQFFTDPEKVARDIQVKTLSRNLLRKYGLDPYKETEEQGGQVEGTGGPRQAGRTAMTKERKEMIKGGSFIALGRQGAL